MQYIELDCYRDTKRDDQKNKHLLTFYGRIIHGSKSEKKTHIRFFSAHRSNLAHVPVSRRRFSILGILECGVWFYCHLNDTCIKRKEKCYKNAYL